MTLFVATTSLWTETDFSNSNKNKTDVWNVISLQFYMLNSVYTRLNIWKVRWWTYFCDRANGKISNISMRNKIICRRLAIWILLVSKLYWTQVITQFVNGLISVWICGVGQPIRDILLNYSQRIFGARWVTSLQHDCLSSNRIGQNVFWVAGACQEVKNLKKIKILYSNVRPKRCGMSLENPLLQFHKI